MVKIFRYKILVPHKTIIAYYQGEINVQDLIEFKVLMSNDPDYDPAYNLILDFRKCRMNFGQEGVLEYIEFVKNNDKIRVARNTLFLTDRPNEVALTILFDFLKGQLPLKTAVFTTVEALLKWLFGSFENNTYVHNEINELTKVKQVD
tara:strand:+ start:8635 stop:9078 length:444 start_codon:yes stop_codon:yes gene_type:complete